MLRREAVAGRPIPVAITCVILHDFLPGLRVADGRVQRGDEHAVYRRFDVARLHVFGSGGQVDRGDDRLAAREDGDAIPGSLPAPHGAIARVGDRLLRNPPGEREG